MRQEEDREKEALEEERRRLDELVTLRAEEWKAQFLQEAMVLRLAEAMWCRIVPLPPEGMVS
jgi:hypothetical protein